MRSTFSMDPRALLGLVLLCLVALLQLLQLRRLVVRPSVPIPGDIKVLAVASIILFHPPPFLLTFPLLCNCNI